jgi:putative zinc finger protein
MAPKILTQALQPGADCPALDVLGRFADDALPPAERRAAAAHIGGCAVCQSELALLQTFADGDVRDDERSDVRAIVAELRRRESEIFPAPAAPEIRQSRFALFGSLRHALSLATVLLAVVGGYLIFQSTPPRLPSDAVSDAGATRSLTVELRAPIGDQAAAPQRLEWRPVPGAARYRARLMEVDRTELWSIDTTATAVEIPEPIRALVVPAKTLQWQVTAYDASNAPVGESSLERFRLARP